jgi:hypothetical protein
VPYVKKQNIIEVMSEFRRNPRIKDFFAILRQNNFGKTKLKVKDSLSCA